MLQELDFLQSSSLLLTLLQQSVFSVVWSNTGFSRATKTVWSPLKWFFHTVLGLLQILGVSFASG